MLEETGLDPRALRLEVKENALSREPEAVQRVLRHALETHGVRSHIDDFGTGAHRCASCTASRATRSRSTARW